MLVALAAGGVGIAAGDVLLVVFSWRSRTVLSGVVSVVGILLVGFAISSGLTGATAEAALVVALVFLIVGTVLYCLGQFFERLLSTDSDDGS